MSTSELKVPPGTTVGQAVSAAASLSDPKTQTSAGNEASPHPLFDKVVSKLPELVAKFKKEPYDPGNRLEKLYSELATDPERLLLHRYLIQCRELNQAPFPMSIDQLLVFIFSHAMGPQGGIIRKTLRNLATDYRGVDKNDCFGLQDVDKIVDRARVVQLVTVKAFPDCKVINTVGADMLKRELTAILKPAHVLQPHPPQPPPAPAPSARPEQPRQISVPSALIPKTDHSRVYQAYGAKRPKLPPPAISIPTAPAPTPAKRPRYEAPPPPRNPQFEAVYASLYGGTALSSMNAQVASVQNSTAMVPPQPQPAPKAPVLTSPAQALPKPAFTPERPQTNCAECNILLAVSNADALATHLLAKHRKLTCGTCGKLMGSTIETAQAHRAVCVPPAPRPARPTPPRPVSAPSIPVFAPAAPPESDSDDDIIILPTPPRPAAIVARSQPSSPALAGSSPSRTGPSPSITIPISLAPISSFSNIPPAPSPLAYRPHSAPPTRAPSPVSAAALRLDLTPPLRLAMETIVRVTGTGKPPLPPPQQDPTDRWNAAVRELRRALTEARWVKVPPLEKCV